MSKERILDLWNEAVQGLSASNEDILDLIEEVTYLRDTYNIPTPELPKRPAPTRLRLVDCTTPTTLSPDPWAEEWPGNP